MNATYCCLSVALNHIPGNHFLLEAAKSELAIAVNCAERYEKTWHSIIWIRSNTRTKIRIRHELNYFAFEFYTHFLKAVDYLNQYANFMNEQGVPVANWWWEMACSLNTASRAIHRENKQEIFSRQQYLSQKKRVKR